MSTEPHPTSRPSASGARRSRAYLTTLVAAPLLALASAQAETEPDRVEPGGGAEHTGAAGLAGSGSGGAAGWGGLGGSGSGGSGIGGSGARPLAGTLLDVSMSVPPRTPPQAKPLSIPLGPPSLQTTLRRNAQLENGSEQALGDPTGSSVSAPTSDLMVLANGSCEDEADQVGVARNPRDRAP